MRAYASICICWQICWQLPDSGVRLELLNVAGLCNRHSGLLPIPLPYCRSERRRTNANPAKRRGDHARTVGDHAGLSPLGRFQEGDEVRRYDLGTVQLIALRRSPDGRLASSETRTYAGQPRQQLAKCRSTSRIRASTCAAFAATAR
jgi:hypothetical protein